MRRDSAAFAILVGGGVAGFLDITYAIVFSTLRGGTPTRLLQTVASGALGLRAYDGGAATALLGLLFHFAMTFAIAAVFYAASTRSALLTRRPVLMGALYGVIVFGVMKLVVLPASAFPYPVTFSLLASGTDLLSHMFFVGVPIALAARAASRGYGTT